MIADLLIVGVDPGETTGVVALPYWYDTDRRLYLWVAGVRAAQCDRRTALDLVDAWMVGTDPPPRAMLAVEAFVVSARAARSSTPRAGVVTRELIHSLAVLAANSPLAQDMRHVTRRATDVKPWATDERLRAAGLYTPVGGHARDAARHALFAAHHDAGVSDPLSRKDT